MANGWAEISGWFAQRSVLPMVNLQATGTSAAQSREPIGRGLRIPVASPGDLVRMLSARGQERDKRTIETIQRVVEHDRGLTWER